MFSTCSTRKTNQIEYFYVSRLPGEPLDAWRTVMSIPSNRLRSVLRWLAGSDGDHLGYLKMSAHNGRSNRNLSCAEPSRLSELNF